MEEKNQNSGLATAGLVLGIIAACISFIPIINNLAFIMGGLAVIFGIIAFIKKAGKGNVIAAIILGVIAITITISSQKALSEGLNEVSKELNKVTGSSTEEVLKNDIEVALGKFEVIKGEYGITNTKLVVKVKNKTSNTKSFNLQVEAVNSKGARIIDDCVIANNLAAGQSQEFEIFTYIPEEKIEPLKNATFKIIQASMY